MAKFKKGESGNPKGRPPEPGPFKQIRMLTKMEFAEIANRMLKMTKAELKEVERADHSNVLERMMAKALLSATENKDVWTLNFFLERLIGRVPQPKETAPEEEDLTKVPDDKLLEMGREAFRVLEGGKS